MESSLRLYMRFGLFLKILLVNIFMVILSFSLPVAENKHIESILIAATFIFGTIYSFEIFIVLGNFTELKKLLATETANLVFIYHTAKDIGDGFLKEM